MPEIQDEDTTTEVTAEGENDVSEDRDQEGEKIELLCVEVCGMMELLSTQYSSWKNLMGGPLPEATPTKSDRRIPPD